IRIDAINEAIKGLPKEQIRLHLCWGSWHGPHATDIELKHILRTVLGANVGQISCEAANARHEHEWTVWRDNADIIPDDLVLVPGVVSHSTNLIEHPELVAPRIERFASVVGPDRVIAATDCGLGGRVHEQIAWAKPDALGAGARLAAARVSRSSSPSSATARAADPPTRPTRIGSPVAGSRLIHVRIVVSASASPSGVGVGVGLGEGVSSETGPTTCHSPASVVQNGCS